MMSFVDYLHHGSWLNESLFTSNWNELKMIGCIWLNWLQVLSAIMEREPEAQPAHHHLPWEKPPIVRFSHGRPNNLPWEILPLWEVHTITCHEKTPNCERRLSTTNTSTLKNWKTAQKKRKYMLRVLHSQYIQILWKRMRFILDFHGWFLPLIHKMRPREPKE